MADITMSLGDTLELDTIIEESSRASNPIGNIQYEDSSTSDYISTGIQTHTEVFEPKKSGTYTIPINGQKLKIKVTEPRSIPSSVLPRPDDNKFNNNSGRRGIQIRPNSNFDSVAARISANTSANDWQVLNDIGNPNSVFG